MITILTLSLSLMEEYIKRKNQSQIFQKRYLSSYLCSQRSLRTYHDSGERVVAGHTSHGMLLIWFDPLKVVGIERTTHDNLREIKNNMLQ